MPVPRYLVIEWPKLGTLYYSTQGYDNAWITLWLLKVVYTRGNIAYFTNQEPKDAKFRG